jgi:site-specific DNA recombinase
MVNGWSHATNETVSGKSTRAAIYCRVSSAGQEDNSSLETQEAACRAYAAEQGWTVVAIYREVHTRVELWERRQLGVLREAVRRRAVDAVVCHAIDRLSGDPVHLGVILSEADHAGVAVRFVTEPLDDSPEGQLIRFVRGYAAKVEHEKIKERTMRGRRARVESGKLLPGPRPPYGYRWADDQKTRLIENPTTAPIIRCIFQEIASGVSARKVAQRLTAEGVPTPTGKNVWLGATITKMVKHPVYTGQATAWRWHRDRVKGEGVKQRQRAVADQLVIEGAAPALISAEWATTAQVRLAANKSEATRNNRVPESALLRAGYVRCGYCGGALTVNNGTKGGAAYQCGTTARDRHGCPYFGIKTANLDAVVWTKVEAVLTQPEMVRTHVERSRREDPAAADVGAVGRRLAEVARKQRNLVARLADVDDEDVAALVQSDLANLAVEKQRLEQERAGLERKRENWRTAEANLDSVEAWCRLVAANLGDLTYGERRMAVGALGIDVRVWARDHDPRYQITMQLGVVEPTIC